MNHKEKYEEQRNWSDSYIPFVSRTIINSLNLDPNIWHIKVTTPEQDMKEAADLILTDGDEEFMIALRLRNRSYMADYPFDFTIRREYTAGYKTEYEKIMEGFADMMFYGFREGNKIVRWVFMSMDEFRFQHMYDDAESEWYPKDYIVYQRKDNRDGRNCFNGYDILSFPNIKDLIITHSPGYFEDVVITNIPGLSSTVYRLKRQEERLDK
jgi:hypothetical protein